MAVLAVKGVGPQVQGCGIDTGHSRAFLTTLPPSQSGSTRQTTHGPSIQRERHGHPSIQLNKQRDFSFSSSRPVVRRQSGRSVKDEVAKTRRGVWRFKIGFYNAFSAKVLSVRDCNRRGSHKAYFDGLSLRYCLGSNRTKNPAHRAGPASMVPSGCGSDTGERFVPDALATTQCLRCVSELLPNLECSNGHWCMLGL